MNPPRVTFNIHIPHSTFHIPHSTFNIRREGAVCPTLPRRLATPTLTLPSALGENRSHQQIRNAGSRNRRGNEMKTLVLRSFLVAMVLTLATPALPLFAHTAEEKKPEEKKTAEEKKKEEQPKVTEEMVVTARKREETVQNIPISVAAPTESELRDRGAENIEDIAANVAGFTVQHLGPGQSQIAMRGGSAG